MKKLNFASSMLSFKSKSDIENVGKKSNHLKLLLNILKEIMSRKKNLFVNHLPVENCDNWNIAFRRRLLKFLNVKYPHNIILSYAEEAYKISFNHILNTPFSMKYLQEPSILIYYSIFRFFFFYMYACANIL